MTTILRPGKTPNGREGRGHLRRLTRSIRRHWPNMRILFRGDSHYGRVEAMEWCENNGEPIGLRPDQLPLSAGQPDASDPAHRGLLADGTIRDVIPADEPLASGAFSTLRLRLLKIGVRVRETGTRIRLGFATHCPNAVLFRELIGALKPLTG